MCTRLKRVKFGWLLLGKVIREVGGTLKRKGNIILKDFLNGNK